LLREILVSLRPRQWLKNLVLFAGLIFSLNFFNGPRFLIVLAAALVFCVVSGSIYLFNDVWDVALDRAHPEKRNRPVASGRLPRRVALFSAVFFMFWALALAFFLSRDFFLILTLFAGIGIAYSAFLKNVVILDVFCIAACFLLRVLAGAVVIDVPISSWLVLCTIFLSLFLALAKRRSELVRLESGAAAHRRVLSEYSLVFIDQMTMIVTASTILAYALYTLAPETRVKFYGCHLEFTILFVIYGVFRYLYLVYQKHEGGAPEKVLLSDKSLWVNLLLYLASVLILIY
jgi:4-hydroxybenzoate polyprenyltransferase